MRNIEIQCIKMLEAIEASANIQFFAKQWVAENGIHTLDDLFALLDRIKLPYFLVSKSAQLSRYKCAFAVQDDENILTGSIVNGRFTPASEQEYPSPIFYIAVKDLPSERHSDDWIGDRLHAFKPMIPKVLLMSFIINTFMLAIPFITMSVYDHVIGGHAGHELVGISVGALSLFMMMGWLRTLRNRIFVSIANRISKEISHALVKKLLNSSYSSIQQSPATNQHNQILLSERIAKVLSGPLGSALFDLPFVIIFILAIGILGEWLVVVPLLSIFLYFIAVKYSLKSAQLNNKQATVFGTNRQAMNLEFGSKLSFLRSAKFLSYWLKRFYRVNWLASHNSFTKAVRQQRIMSIFHVINASSTLAIMGLGIGLIFEEILTPGGLIASMMLIARVTGPVQTIANNALNFQSYSLAKKQVNHLLSQADERDFNYQHHQLPTTAPSLKMEQVTFRYPKQSRPALNNINVKINAGDIIAVTGPAGSGKSTLIDILSGLHDLQHGTIEVADINLAQYDPQLFRHWAFIRAAYPDLVSISIKEWLSDGKDIDDEKMRECLKLVGALDWFNTLPNGLDTRISDVIPDSHFDMLSGTVAQYLIDAKALVYDYKLMLLHNPVPDSHPDAMNAFLGFLKRNQKRATIFYSTHDPQLIKAADSVIVLNKGMVAYAGPIQNDDQGGPK